jgi:hypothetical protein
MHADQALNDGDILLFNFSPDALHEVIWVAERRTSSRERSEKCWQTQSLRIFGCSALLWTSMNIALTSSPTELSAGLRVL